MTRFTLAILLSLISFHFAKSQTLTIDAAHAAAVTASAVSERSSFNDMKSKQDLINRVTTSTVATTQYIHEWHKKMYDGLKTVSNNVHNGYQVYRAGEKIVNILDLQKEILELGKQNPLALAWGVEIQKKTVTKASEMYAQIQSVILKMNDDNVLMDAGERITLLNNVLRDLTVIEGLLYYARRKVKWVIQQGIINAINPFAQYVNRDKALVRDILRKVNF